MATVEVTRTYLEMTAPGQLKGARSAAAGLRLVHEKDCAPDRYRFLYKAVGEQYNWMDRRSWTDRQVRAHLAAADISIWVLYQGDDTAGYFEFQRHPDGSIEIVYFGLLPAFHGKGLGKHLLTVAVEQAWALGARRVWLHTCTLDHAAALPNYRARGFVPFKTEVYLATLPAGQDRDR